MTVGIVGLGSSAAPLPKPTTQPDILVLAFDTDRSTYDFAVLSGTVNGPLTDETLSTCDLIPHCRVPSAAVGYLKQHAAHIGPSRWSSTAAAPSGWSAPPASRWQSSSALPIWRPPHGRHS